MKHYLLEIAKTLYQIHLRADSVEDALGIVKEFHPDWIVSYVYEVVYEREVKK